MATVNFYYRSKKEQTNLSIKFRFSLNKDNFVITGKTPIRTSLDIWSKIEALRIGDAQLRKQVFEVRNLLSDLENHILKAFEAEPNKVKATQKEWLTTVLNSLYKDENETPTTLVDYVNYYLEVRKNEIEQHLKFKLNGLVKKLKEFEDLNKHEYKILEVNEAFKNLFTDFLQSKDYSHNYIRKQFSFIRQVCNHAVYNGLEVSPQLKKIGLKAHKVPTIFLTPDELEQIENTEFETENLTATKDWLIISYYTGQRVSDFMRFRTDMIRTENGKHLIEFTQKKTKKTMTIPVHKKVLEIIEANEGKFPKKLQDQKYNGYLKEVCKIAEVNEPTNGRKSINIGTEKNPVYRYKTDFYLKYELISSHVGRRSFATNFYGKIPTTYLIYITGHSTEAMFLNYIGKSNKDLALEVSDYFNAL
jgi:integrase